MPTYEFSCSRCGHTFSEMYPISSDPRMRVDCTLCNAKHSARRLIGSGVIATARLARENKYPVVSYQQPLWAGKERGFVHDDKGHVIFRNKKDKDETAAGALTGEAQEPL